MQGIFLAGAWSRIVSEFASAGTPILATICRNLGGIDGEPVRSGQGAAVYKPPLGAIFEIALP